MGVAYETFWSEGFNQKAIDSFVKAYSEKQKLIDTQMWYMGLYVNNAVTVAIDHCLNGKKAKSEYLKQPLLHDVKLEKEEVELTEEQKMQKTEALFKMLEGIGNRNKSKSGRSK